MTNAQKIRLRLSQVRQRLNEIAGVEGDAFTDEVRSEAASLQAEFADLETRHQAAIVAEGEGETRATGDDLDAEARERLELRSLLPFAGVVFARWGSTPGQPYVGTGPISTWAHTTARLGSETERSLADEAAGPLAQLLAIPADGGDDSEDDPLAALKADVRTARGKALLVETVAAGWGEGATAAPRRDWTASRLGPSPPAALAEIRRDSFAHVLASTGTPPSLFVDADGTAQREAVRRWHLGTVLPLARILESELTVKLEAAVRLQFDAYPLDLAGRAQAFQKLVAGGVDVTEALATAGLLTDDAA